jgi:hypothetical protein
MPGRYPNPKKDPPGGWHQHLPVIASLWSHLLPVRDEVLGRLLLLLLLALLLLLPLPALLVHLFAWRGRAGRLDKLGPHIGGGCLDRSPSFLAEKSGCKGQQPHHHVRIRDRGGAKEEVLSFCMLVTAWR